jgi:hypothetical protein
MSCYSPSVSDVRRGIREPRHLPLLALLAAPLLGLSHELRGRHHLICHTQIKVERFVALFSEDTQGAIDAVNAEEQDSTACALINAAYLRGRKIGMRETRTAPLRSSESSYLALISRCSASRNTRCKPSTGEQRHAA